MLAGKMLSSGAEALSVLTMRLDFSVLIAGTQLRFFRNSQNGTKKSLDIE